MGTGRGYPEESALGMLLHFAAAQQQIASGVGCGYCLLDPRLGNRATVFLRLQSRGGGADEIIGCVCLREAALNQQQHNGV